MKENSRVFRKRFKLGKLIGEGAFGEIYSGIDIENGREIAIKVEQLERKYLFLQNEAKVYKTLQGNPGIPLFYWAGIEGDYYILVLELLGDSLDHIYRKCQKKLSLASVLFLGQQMVERIECIHSSEYLHRDIKPGNFMMGTNDNSRLVYIIDFGMAKKYTTTAAGLHISYSDSKELVGTARYSSVNSHMGIEPTRRDDMECLAYTLIYLAKGILPWQGLEGSCKKEKYNRIMSIKSEISAEELCSGLPPQFATILRAIKGLRFDEKPNYKWFKKELRDCFIVNKCDVDFELDWVKLKARENKIRANTPPSRSKVITPGPRGERRSTNLLSTDQLKARIGVIHKLIASSPPNKKTIDFQDECAKKNKNKIKEENKGSLRINIVPKIDLVPRSSVSEMALNKKATQEFSDRNSCNFMTEDIIEDTSIIDETIPNEKPLYTKIKIPLFNFINNAAHWRKHKNNKDSNIGRRKSMQTSLHYESSLLKVDHLSPEFRPKINNTSRTLKLFLQPVPLFS
eukprot:TRINITY_DN4485_c0_g1_i1.p1 TRINITY_DN4485_c0_g1~~TRINITY_DN4485_c0_g1_i1.p1  ORF type:complete len:514 (-),score=79.72 TRINITY_DN4485_c0_g1_i1:16-1557(-)